jgi:SAM-dependent methyltransferase
MTEPSFKELEHAGWSQRAGAYDTWFSHITSQANEPLLDALGKHLGGVRLLDVCTGTGYLAAAAAKRGALAEGVDFSREMVEQARVNHSAVPFREGDAEQLPYDDRSFDHVVCAFGHLHLPNADQAIAEAACSGLAVDMLSPYGARISRRLFSERNGRDWPVREDRCRITAFAAVLPFWRPARSRARVTGRGICRRANPHH